MEPRVAVADLKVDSADGTFEIGRESFPQFTFLERLGVHVQSDRVRVANPDPAYVQAALTALTEACLQLGVPEAAVVFVDTVIPRNASTGQSVKSRIGITFSDNSLVSIGPNSVFAIEKYQFDSTTYAGEFEGNLKQGRLAAVSGKMVKQSPESMKIRTPSAIMGVRGTEFLVQVDAPAKP